MPKLTLLQGDALAVLKTLPSDSVHCCVTSPPYYGLRDYGTAQWEGGDAACDHRQAAIRTRRNLAQAANACDGGNRSPDNRSDKDALGLPFREVCEKCGARRIDQQIGLEPTLDVYLSRLVAVFAEVRRVLHPSGVCFVNMGDSYAGGGRGGNPEESAFRKQATNVGSLVPPSPVPIGMKPKDRLLVPFRLALLLQADGWWVRDIICWAKRAPMPESVTDRCTQSWEPIFMLTKAARYYFDMEAVREPVSPASLADGRTERGTRGTKGEYAAVDGNCGFDPSGRNLRNVWLLSPSPYPDAHFATFVPEIPKRCILAGTSAKGVCPKCGEPWVRWVEDGKPDLAHQRACGGDANGEYSGQSQKDYAAAKAQDASATKARILRGMVEKKTLGWSPGCACGGEPVPATVLDPFAGTFTTGAVALDLGRHAIGIELSAEYVKLAERRCAAVTPGLALA